MSYKMTVNVPRITPDAIAEMEKLVPGLSSVVTIPVIDEVGEDLEEAARAIAVKLLVQNPYEYVAAIDDIKVSQSGGWDVELVIAGD